MSPQAKAKASLPSEPRAREPVVAVLLVIFTVADGDLRVLLTRRGIEPFRGWWAIPGGRLLARDESLDAAAARKLVDETGVRDVFLEQLYTFGELDRTTADGAVAIAYFALVDHRRVQLESRREWPTRWFSMGDLPELAFDNRRVLDYALQRLRYKLEYTNVAYSLLPEEFTMSQLQTVYETIHGRRLDKRNFRKRMLSLGIITPTGKKHVEGAHRPAELFAFTKREPIIL
jgi:8-oxo-dGTP diphosphatase